MTFLKYLLLVLTSVLAPVAASAAVVPFVEGMTFTVPVGQTFQGTYALDPCAGVTLHPASSCSGTDYVTGQSVVTEFLNDWASVAPVADAVGYPCGAVYCLDFFFNPQAPGVFSLTFDTTYQVQTVLGGDDYGSEFVVTEIGYAPHSLVLNALSPAAVPVPPALAALGGGLLLLAAPAALRRRRRG
ncbi:MAG: hypothetical protein KDK26_03605 [Roseivivax sp.]|nr:hypothetical protein [Roseivivax sp.]